MFNLPLTRGGGAERRLRLLPEEARSACGGRRARGAEPESCGCRGGPEGAGGRLDGRRSKPGGGRGSGAAAEEPSRLRGGSGEPHGFGLQVDNIGIHIG